MPIADELIGILGYKIEGQENVAKFKKGMDEAEGSARASADRFKKLGVAAGALTAASIAFTGAAVKDFASFERIMTRIGITAGASGIEVAAAAQEVQTLAGDLALPLSEATNALDTLVASGMDLGEAMDFLPDVLAATQASGAAANDMANTAQKAASALGLEAEQMTRAFDIMVTGGKAGQFELRDMAAFIPELANSFASLGYSGEEGLQRLVALLQTVREDTGTASGAATQLQNVFGKMFTEETSKKFANFGIDLRSELEAARDAGEDIVSAFVRISKEAIDGDLTKLPLLFTDQEFRLGMQSLITSEESLQRFLETVQSADVDGAVFRDLNTVVSDTQASIDRMSNSWDRFIKAIGSRASGPVSGALDWLTAGISREEAITSELEKRGVGFIERNTRLGYSAEEVDRLAREGGYVAPGDTAGKIAKDKAPRAFEVLGRMPNRPISRPPERADPAAPSYDAMQGFDAVSAFEDRLAGIDQKIAASGEADNRLAGIAAQVEATNSHLANMTSQAPVDAVITDARQDNRQFPVTVNSTVNQTIQQPSAAPAAVGAATNRAVAGAAPPAARLITGNAR